MASTMSQQQHCSCCRHASSSQLALPPTQLTSATIEAADERDVFADAQEQQQQPLSRSMSPGRAAALGHSDIAPPVHTVIDPARLRSRSRSPWSSMSLASSSMLRSSQPASSNTSRSSSIAGIKQRAEDDVVVPPQSVAVKPAPAPKSEVYGETAAQRAERKAREKEFWDLRKPHVWNLLGNCGGGRRS